MRKYLPSMKPRTHPRIAIFPVVNAFAVRVAALVVAHVLVAIGSNENALAVLEVILKGDVPASKMRTGTQPGQ